MRASDYARAAGLAFAVMLVNFVIGIGAVLVYRVAIAPGHDSSFYDQAALTIVPWAVGVAAPLLFAAVAFAMAKRRPERGWRFALWLWLFYVAIDALATIAMGELASVLTLAMAALLLADLVGALAGVWLAERGAGRAEAEMA